MPVANEKRLFLTILLGYLVVAPLYARYTPAWQLPDEPAHFNYIRQIVEAGCCPRIEDGDWSSEYLGQLTSGRFAPELLGELDGVQYEDHHPPLYYLLAAVVYSVSGGDLVALRLLSVTLGAGLLVLSYLVCRSILPEQPQVALGVMALVAFLPQHLHMMSAVNNDALAELIVGLALLWLLRFLRSDSVPIWQLGLIVGLAFLTKLTIYFLALPTLLAIWLKWRHGSKPTPELLRSLAIFALIAGVIGGVWWLRNISAYGFPDFLGLAAHNRVVDDQPRTSDYVAEHGAQSAFQHMLSRTFKSFWGQFGWMALPLDNVLGGWIYRGFGLLAVAGVSGALVASRRREINGAFRVVLLASLLIVLVQFLYYNIEFRQWQGRYLFPALIPISFVLVYGLDHWRAQLPGRWERAQWIIPIGLLGLLALDLYLLFRVIAPGLSSGQ